MYCSAIQNNILFCAKIKWTVFWKKVAKKLLGSIRDQGKLNIHAYLIFETSYNLMQLLMLEVFWHLVTISKGTANQSEVKNLKKNAPYVWVVSSFTQPSPRKLIACVLISINYSNYLIPSLCQPVDVDIDDDDGDTFNLIQPTLFQQIRNILDQYPDDGQILKVKGFCLNWRLKGMCSLIPGLTLAKGHCIVFK